ncbi:hypothetical protein GCM10020218_021770 [Dactylosporangium vinaceum]
MPPAESEIDRRLRRARQRLDDRDHQAALALVIEALRLDRRHPGAHLLQAECLLAGDEPARALEAAQTARGHDGDAALTERIDAVVARCRAAIAADALEAARACLRRGDHRRALDHLSRVPDASADVLTYARGDRALDPARLEAVLRWLTQEELAAARQALADQQYDRARRECGAAAKIDPRGRQCALLGATALLGLYYTAVAQDQPPALETLQRTLRQAAELARKAADDETLRHELAPVQRDIQARLRTVAEALVQRAAWREIKALADRYRGVMDAYDRMVTSVQAGNIRASLAPIAIEVGRLREVHPPASPEGETLRKLAEAIARVMHNLR